MIQRSKKFNENIYTKLEIMRTESALRNVEECINWSYIKRDDVTKVPFLSLQILSQNVRILSEAGKDMLDKSRHLKTLSSVEEIQNLQLEGLRETLTSVMMQKYQFYRLRNQSPNQLEILNLKRQEDLYTKIYESKSFNKHLTKKLMNLQN